MNRIFLKLSIIIFTLSSCVALKPDSSQLSTPDYNKRVEVKDAHFDKILTPVGYGSIVVSTIAGGYYGYKSDMIQYYSGNERKSFAAGGALIGAATSFTISYLLNKALGWGKVYPMTEPNKWIEKANKNYKFISAYGTNIKVVHKSAEQSYIVKNTDDAKDFTLAFPGSFYSDNVFKSGIENCSRNDMPVLINYFPNSKFTNDAKIKFVKYSPTYEEIISAQYKYPSLGLNLEPEFSNLIKTIPNALDFKTRYPNTLLGRKAVCNAFGTEANSKKNIIELKAKYKNEFELNSNDLKTFGNNTKNRNYLNGLYLLKDPTSIFEVDDFYSLYSWVNYENKGTDVMEKYWNVGVRTLDEGNLIIGAIYSLQGSKYDISEYKIKNFIRTKLEYEVRTKVSITRNTLESKDSQWNDWINNNNLTAGLVSQKGDVKFLVYGEISNNSIFDLPIEILAKGDLRAKFDVQGTGTFTNAWVAIVKAFAQSQGGSIAEDKYLTSTKEIFYIPNLPAKSKSTYAVILNFGENIGNAGVNVMDLLKSTKTVYLANDEVSTKYGELTNITNEKLKIQQSWQEMAINGLPDSKLTDLWRGEEVNNGEWVSKYNARLEAAKEAERERQSAMRSGTCYRFLENVKVHGSDVDYVGYYVECYDGYNKTVYFHDYWRIDEGLFFGNSKIYGLKDYDSWEAAAKKACGCN